MKRRLVATVCLAFAAWGLCAAALAQTPPGAPAQFEAVEVDMSASEVAIKSDFTGAEIVVFGAIDAGKQAATAAGYYDVIMVIRGPTQSVVTRKKERLAGIWVNGDSETFIVSSFYAVLSNRPLAEIANTQTLRSYGIEFNPKAQNADGRIPQDPFEDAMIRLKEQQALYVEKPSAVEFRGRSLFRGNVTLPTQVAQGQYTARVYLLRSGQLLSRDEVSLTVRKEGIERILYTLAYQRPWLYGVISVLLAVACGLLGWTLFNRS